MLKPIIEFKPTETVTLIPNSGVQFLDFGFDRALARKLSRMSGEAEKAGGMTKWLATRDEDRRIRSAQLDLSGGSAPGSGQMMGGGAPMASAQAQAPAAGATYRPA